MNVRAGQLSDEDRALLVESNREGRRVLVATRHACLIRDQRDAPHCEEPAQAVGIVTGWNYDAVQLGGWSFEWSVPWESIVAVWWRGEAPSSDLVAKMLERNTEGEQADG